MKTVSSFKLFSFHKLKPPPPHVQDVKNVLDSAQSFSILSIMDRLIVEKNRY